MTDQFIEVFPTDHGSGAAKQIMEWTIEATKPFKHISDKQLLIDVQSAKMADECKNVMLGRALRKNPKKAMREAQGRSEWIVYHSKTKGFYLKNTCK